jgi:predicted pyridoxine 5'-phosphate oxidase superfamily flavin-nucleotide-binding protein
MGILTEDMKRVVREQLGFHATVCEDGTPNLSPKGCTFVWDDDHLFFAHIRSPQTVANIRRGSWVEVNLVDPFVRKGYRFKGPAAVYEPSSTQFDEGIERLRAEGVGANTRTRVTAIAVVEVQQARPLISPAYDDGVTTEAEVARTFHDRFAALHEHLLDRAAT